MDIFGVTRRLLSTTWSHKIFQIIVITCIQSSLSSSGLWNKKGFERLLAPNSRKMYLSWPDFSVNPSRDYSDFSSTYAQYEYSWKSSYSRDSNPDNVNRRTTPQTIQCFACSSSDPGSSCVIGNVSVSEALHKKDPKNYANVQCDGYCYVKRYTLYGTNMMQTQRGCFPEQLINEVCSRQAHCSASESNCVVECCGDDWCNLSPLKTPSMAVSLFLPLISFFSTLQYI